MSGFQKKQSSTVGQDRISGRLDLRKTPTKTRKLEHKENPPLLKPSERWWMFNCWHVQTLLRFSSGNQWIFAKYLHSVF
jgi:hypothetical protein